MGGGRQAAHALGPVGGPAPGHGRHTLPETYGADPDEPGRSPENYLEEKAEEQHRASPDTLSAPRELADRRPPEQEVIAMTVPCNSFYYDYGGVWGGGITSPPWHDSYAAAPWQSPRPP